MATTTLVAKQIEESKLLLKALASGGLLVANAFWANKVEDDRWRLIVASPTIDRDGVLPWYRAILKLFGELRINAFSPSDVILMEVHNVMVDDIVSNTISTLYPESGYSQYGAFSIYHLLIDDLGGDPKGSDRITFSEGPSALTTTTARPIIQSGFSSAYTQRK